MKSPDCRLSLLRRYGGAFLTLCAAALSICVGCRRDQGAGSTEARVRPTSLLLVTLDTTRADRLGCYGYQPAQTPTLDDLARRGTLFRNVVSPVPMTLPAHTSIVTGLYPREHGVRVNGQNSVPDALVTLAELFRDRGVRTGAFVGSFVLDGAFGLNQGFDTYDDEIDKSGDDQLNLAAERPANEVTDRALDWLSASPDKPFFCWIHYYDAHDPYEPPPPYSFTVGNPYDGELAFIDAQFKRVTDWLDEARLRDRTSIVVVGDHGEAFGEHREHGHVMFLYQANVHVPLLIDHPGASRAGAVVDSLVGLTDVAPTIAELFNLTGLAGRGRSLVAALSGASVEPKPAYSESHYGSYSYGWAQQRSITTQRWKYISSTQPELFDLDADPGEWLNRVDAEPDVASRLADALKQMYASMTPATVVDAVLNEDARRRLESLGYVSAGSTTGGDEFLTEGTPDPKAEYDVVEETNKAKVLVDARQWAQALPLLEAVAKRCPGAYYIAEQLARCYQELERTNDAIDTWRSVLEVDPRNIAAIVRFSQLLLKTHATEEAIEHLLAAVSLDETNVRAHETLALALRQAGRLDEAEAHARRAGVLGPSSGRVMITLGTIQAELGRFDDAVKTFERAGESPSSRVEALRNLATLAIQQGKPDDAIARLDAVLAIVPADPSAVGSITKLYHQRRRTAEMVRVLSRAVEADPDNLAFTFSLAQLLATGTDDSVRNGAEALRLTHHAVELTRGDNAAVLALHAAAYAETGAFDEAIATAQRAIQRARQDGAQPLVDRTESQLDGYRAKRPFRDPAL